MAPNDKRSGPSDADTAKQMAEINQFANARILTLLAAVALVAASSGILLPEKLTSDAAEIGRTFFGSSVVVVAVAFLVGVDRRLTRLIKWYAAWLLHYQKSAWERDAKLYLSTKQSWSINRPMWVAYFALAAAMLALPWAQLLFTSVSLAQPFQWPTKGVAWLHVIACAGSFAFIVAQKYRDISVQSAESAWRECLMNDDQHDQPQSASPSPIASMPMRTGGDVVYGRWREELKNEDERIGERSNWALGLQGLLFVAFTQSGQLASSGQPPVMIDRHLAPTWIAIAGFAAACLSLASIYAAVRRMKEIREKIKEVQREYLLTELDYPQIGGDWRLPRMGLFMAVLMPVVLMIVWGRLGWACL